MSLAFPTSPENYTKIIQNRKTDHSAKPSSLCAGWFSCL